MPQTQHYVHLLTFPFRGENAARKFVLACVVVAASYIVPVLPLILFLGYVFQIMREVGSGGTARMPVWMDFGKLFRDGLKLFGVGFIYTIPINLVFFGGFFLYFVSTIYFIIAVERAPNSAAPLLFGFAPFFLLFMMAIGYLLLLFVGIIFPPAVGNLVEKGRFTAGFEFGRMWHVMRSNSGGYLVAFLLVLGLLSLLMFAAQIIYMTVILCFLLPLVGLILLVYIFLVAGALFADAYRTGANKLAAGGIPSANITA
jgi:hypothetical protein